MNLLLVNDDSINAKGIRELALHLSREHTVTIVAPKDEMSGVAHAFTIFTPLYADKVDIGKGITAYSVSGTPSDCVKMGVTHLCTVKPDVVISGLNYGENAGISAFYSGTVAGAREGAMNGIRSIAISTANFSDEAAEYAAKWLSNTLKKLADGSFSFDGTVTFLNVNFPACNPAEIKGSCFTAQGTTPFDDGYEKRVSPSKKEYYWLHGSKTSSTNPQIDECAILDNFVTITPLSLDMTDKKFLDKYQKAGNGILNL
ncbi:MAG: 5'/3'-nucleotidase SurE [Fibrobacteres bacterium]|nr:5'/3'-nucleotidase SurE [Fibrobacterota bacterium]